MAEQDQRTPAEGDANKAHNLMWLTIVAAAAVLAAAFFLLIIDGDFGQPQFQFLIGGVAVPLLTFAGFLAVYLGFQAQKEQNRLLEKQHSDERFEDTFFRLVTLHNEVVDSLNYEIGLIRGASGWPHQPAHRIVEGRDCFQHFYEMLGESVRNQRRNFARLLAGRGDISANTSKLIKENKLSESVADWTQSYEKRVLDDAYNEFWEDNRTDLEPYFQSLEQVLTHMSSRSADENSKYASIVVAQLSKYELLLLAYHCAASKFSGNLKKLIAKYRILRNLPEDELIDSRHSDFIDNSAVRV